MKLEYEVMCGKCGSRIKASFDSILFGIDSIPDVDEIGCNCHKKVKK